MNALTKASTPGLSGSPSPLSARRQAAMSARSASASRTAAMVGGASRRSAARERSLSVRSCARARRATQTHTSESAPLSRQHRITHRGARATTSAMGTKAPPPQLTTTPHQPMTTEDAETTPTKRFSTIYTTPSAELAAWVNKEMGSPKSSPRSNSPKRKVVRSISMPASTASEITASREPPVALSNKPQQQSTQAATLTPGKSVKKEWREDAIGLIMEERIGRTRPTKSTANTTLNAAKSTADVARRKVGSTMRAPASARPSPNTSARKGGDGSRLVARLRDVRRLAAVALSDRSVHLGGAAALTLWTLTQCSPSRLIAWWYVLGMLNGAVLLALMLRADAVDSFLNRA